MGSYWLSARREFDSSFTTKLVLRILATLLTLGSLIAAVIVVEWHRWGVYFGIFFIPAWAMSIGWNVVWYLIMLRRKQPIVPGVIVAFDLIIWGYFAVSAIFGWIEFAALIDDSYYWNHYYDSNYYSSSSYLTGWVSSCLAGSAACAMIALALHFWLFVLGCIDEDRRRKAIKKTMNQATVVAGPVDNSIVCCVDCQAPVEIRCGHCSAHMAARDSKYFGPPEYVTAVNVPEAPASRDSMAKSPV